MPTPSNTIEYLNRQLAAGKIRGYVDKGAKGKKIQSGKKAYKGQKNKDWVAKNLFAWCIEWKAILKTEYKFCDGRKFKFDWAIPKYKIAIEYEGLFSAKSRHTTPTGFTGDTEKYNLAASLGWRVVRVTAMNYKQVIGFVDEIIKNT